MSTCDKHQPGDCYACKRCPECGGRALLIGGVLDHFQVLLRPYRWWCHDVGISPDLHRIGCGWTASLPLDEPMPRHPGQDKQKTPDPARSEAFTDAPSLAGDERGRYQECA